MRDQDGSSRETRGLDLHMRSLSRLLIIIPIVLSSRHLRLHKRLRSLNCFITGASLTLRSDTCAAELFARKSRNVNRANEIRTA